MEGNSPELLHAETAPVAHSPSAASHPDAVEAISMEPGQTTPTGRPTVTRHASSPATLFRSPTRHHKRTHSMPRKEVKVVDWILGKR